MASKSIVSRRKPIRIVFLTKLAICRIVATPEGSVKGLPVTGGASARMYIDDFTMNTPSYEEMLFAINHITIIGDGLNGDAIRRALAKIPPDVMIWAAENISFIDASDLSGLAVQVGGLFDSKSFHGEDLGRHLVVIVILGEKHADGRRVEEREREFTIAREIAHHFCGHDADEHSEQSELEAIQQAAEWGFSQESVPAMKSSLELWVQ